MSDRALTTLEANVLDALHTHGPLRVDELAHRLDTDTVTIRLALLELDAHGYLVTHGGDARNKGGTKGAQRPAISDAPDSGPTAPDATL